MKLVFIGGIHGAGKGKLGSQLADRLDAIHHSAGELIAEHRSSRHIDKLVTDIDGNQEDLLKAIEALNLGSHTVFLDGHFAVLDKKGRPSRISETIFESLAPRAIIWLGVDPVVARKRLLARDGTAPDLESLTLLQESDHIHAQRVATKLEIPVLSLWKPDLALAEVFTLTLLRGGAPK